jgi:hypothetical protein
MKQANWNTNTAKVRVWADSKEPSDAITAISLSITLGDNAQTDEMRSTYWTAIRNLGQSYEDFPKARVGQNNSLDEKQQVVVASAEALLRNAFAAIPTEHHDIMLALIVPHGRTGGVYATFDDLSNSMVMQGIRYMVDAIGQKNGASWDGKKVNKAGIPQITPRPTKAEKDSAKEAEDQG